MDRVLLDSGTAYTKLIHLEDGGYEVLPSRALKDRMGRFQAIAATGHNANRFSSRVLNELLALAYGGLELVAEADFVLVDCGARDIKMVRARGRRVQEMNWNTECGAFCGQTVELLLGHFGLSSEAIPTATRPLAVT